MNSFLAQKRFDTNMYGCVCIFWLFCQFWHIVTFSVSVWVCDIAYGQQVIRYILYQGINCRWWLLWIPPSPSRFSTIHLFWYSKLLSVCLCTIVVTIMAIQRHKFALMLLSFTDIVCCAINISAWEKLLLQIGVPQGAAMLVTLYR